MNAPGVILIPKKACKLIYPSLVVNRRIHIRLLVRSENHWYANSYWILQAALGGDRRKQRTEINKGLVYTQSVFKDCVLND